MGVVDGDAGTVTVASGLFEASRNTVCFVIIDVIGISASIVAIWALSQAAAMAACSATWNAGNSCSAG